MSASTSQNRGFTLVEMLIAVGIASVMIGTLLTVTFMFYGGTVRNSVEAKLAVESQSILRSMVEELRVSSGIRATNTIEDPNAPSGGWTTGNANLVLIIATPVMNHDNNFIIDSMTGSPYQNEIVYYAVDGILYKRYLAASAPGNPFKTSCPEAQSNADCPADVVLSHNFKDMDFVFYDQDDTITNALELTRSVYMTVHMEQVAFGRTITFSNNIRMTMRNSL